MKTLVNGNNTDTISVHNRGLQYGDGIFETIAWRNQRIEHWDEHMARLAKGCTVLGIPHPDFELLKNEAMQLLSEDKGKQILKIILARSSNGRGYQPAKTQSVDRILSCHEWPENIESLAEQGIDCIICTTRLGDNPQLAGIKHLNRLEQVLAAQELLHSEAHEGIMLDQHEQVISGTRSNLFIIKNEILYTPTIDNCGIHGIMRENILRIADGLHLKSEIKPLNMQDLLSADEVFLSNSIMKIWPVNNIEQTHYTQHTWTQKIKTTLQ